MYGYYEKYIYGYYNNYIFAELYTTNKIIEFLNTQDTALEEPAFQISRRSET